MKEVVIQVENLGKLYSIGKLKSESTSFREKINKIITRPFAFHPDHENEKRFLWALRNVSFNVHRGEIVGIIGRNGAGKSTLLKILSSITDPTEGAAEIDGRVATLLEVGTGFHPELTGRENIMLNAAILGMRRSEIKEQFKEIVAFSEIEKFIDTPVKHYSSGMYVRLAFAVAAYLRAEILFVDEVLAVGDAAFQKKCLEKIGEVTKEGRTILFVSHNLQAISSLTQRTILLESGKCIFDGQTSEALQKYRSLWINPSGDYDDPVKEIGVKKARVITSHSNKIHAYGLPLFFEFEIQLQQKPTSAAFSFQIVDEQLKPIVHLWFFDSEKRWSKAGKIKLQCRIEKPRVYMGRYSVNTHLADRASLEILETLEGICSFEVTMDGMNREYEWKPGACAYLEQAEWSILKPEG